MISLVVYGRNDQHGYNSHRRVALSLNAMAEVLTSSDDEILFVDWNTPLSMPTLPQALEDTLTDKALERLRILRVSPEVHDRVTRGRTHLPISEPHARNVAIRRARPGNWILSTNTDMVFVPREGSSLTEIVVPLDGDAYCLPRFEIPEWLWESVPRADPLTMIELLRQWGGRIGLNEVTLGHDWILYDAPGDFQLLRRELVEAIKGFDERMIHGWHVDSNLWKRVHTQIGAIETLYPNVAGYHANHNRSHTVHTGATSAPNDLHEFFFDVTDSVAPGQDVDWGLVDLAIPEIRLQRPDLPRLLAAASTRSSGQEAPQWVSDSRTQMTELAYDARHVLPFILDSILAPAASPVVGYLGINESSAGMLSASLAKLDVQEPLLVGDDAARHAELLVLDLGTDVSTGRGPMTREESLRLLSILRSAMLALASRGRGPRILILNGTSGIWAEWVEANFETLYGTFHTRLQAATIRRGNSTAMPSEHPLAFATRDPGRPMTATQSEGTEVVTLSSPCTFGGVDRGWIATDDHGIVLGAPGGSVRWTTARGFPLGARVTIQMACWTSLPGRDQPIGVAFTLDGIPVFEGDLVPMPQVLNLHLNVGTAIGQDHTLSAQIMKHDGTPYVPHLSGGLDPWLRVERITLNDPSSIELPYGQFERVSPGSNAEQLLDGPWTKTNPYGAWSVAPKGLISLPPTMANDELVLELLAPPERSSGLIRVTAWGQEAVSRDIEVLSDTPSLHHIPLPDPAPSGNITIAFEAIGPPARTGEVVEVRAIGIEDGPTA